MPCYVWELDTILSMSLIGLRHKIHWWKANLRVGQFWNTVPQIRTHISNSKIKMSFLERALYIWFLGYCKNYEATSNPLCPRHLHTVYTYLNLYMLGTSFKKRWDQFLYDKNLHHKAEVVDGYSHIDPPATTNDLYHYPRYTDDLGGKKERWKVNEWMLKGDLVGWMVVVVAVNGWDKWQRWGSFNWWELCPWRERERERESFLLGFDQEK